MDLVRSEKKDQIFDFTKLYVSYGYCSKIIELTLLLNGLIDSCNFPEIVSAGFSLGNSLACDHNTHAFPRDVKSRISSSHVS